MCQPLDGMMVELNRIYYRTIEAHDSRYYVKDYYMDNNVVQMEAICSSVNPKLVQHGMAIWYYKNGAVQRTGVYKEGKPTGLHKSYYENGTPRNETIYQKDKTLLSQYWNKEGKAMLVNGSGFFIETEEEGVSPVHVEVKDSIQVSGYVVESVAQDTVYLMAETPASYRGGFEAFYRGIGNSITYPRVARRNRIQGKVFVQFVVNKSGQMEDIKLVRGIGGGCDEEAMAACKSQTGWIQAQSKGKPVKMRLVLPITFKLN